MNRAVLFHPAPVDESLAALTALCRAALSDRAVQADDAALTAAMQNLVTLLEDCNALRRRRRAASDAVACPIDLEQSEPELGESGRLKVTAP